MTAKHTLSDKQRADEIVVSTDGPRLTVATQAMQFRYLPPEGFQPLSGPRLQSHKKQ